MSDVVADLRTVGVVKLGDSLDRGQLRDMKKYLLGQRVLLGGHVPRCAGSSVSAAEFRRKKKFYGSQLACYDLATIIDCPHLLATGMRYTDIVANYLEKEPTMYSVNIWWSFPSGDGVRPETQAFHRDKDDEKFLVLFLFLTDCRAEGEHVFKAGTHNGAEDGEILRIFGPAGTLILSDTFGYHYGEKPKTKARLTAWVRWGVGNPPHNYGDDGYRVTPTPLYLQMSEREKEVTRFLCKAPED